MLTGIETTKQVLDDFQKIQEYIVLAQKRKCYRNLY